MFEELSNKLCHLQVGVYDTPAVFTMVVPRPVLLCTHRRAEVRNGVKLCRAYFAMQVVVLKVLASLRHTSIPGKFGV